MEKKESCKNRERQGVSFNLVHYRVWIDLDYKSLSAWVEDKFEIKGVGKTKEIEKIRQRIVYLAKIGSPQFNEGYMVFVSLNAKNRMGGYVGMQVYAYLFKDNQLIKVLEPAKISLMRLR